MCRGDLAHVIDGTVLPIQCLPPGSGVGVCQRDRLLGHEPQQALVLRAREYHSDRRATVAACTTELLQIVLHGRRMLQMDYQSNVGHIEAHSKGIGADHDILGWSASAGETGQQHFTVIGRTQS